MQRLHEKFLRALFCLFFANMFAFLELCLHPHTGKTPLGKTFSPCFFPTTFQCQADQEDRARRNERDDGLERKDGRAKDARRLVEEDIIEPTLSDDEMIQARFASIF